VIAGAAVFLVGMALVNVFDGNGSGSGGRIRAPEETRTPKTVKFDAKTTNEVHALISRFVKTAVAGKHLAESYSLIGPQLREDISRKKWATGYTTVVPYPVNGKTYLTYDKNVPGDYQYANSARQQVHVITPNEPSETKLEHTDTFFVFLIKRHGHWLVDNWVPRVGIQIPTEGG
jgi:hypothetical protein